MLYAFITNYEDINYEIIIIDYDDILDSDIEPLQIKNPEIEGVGNETKGREIEVVDAENKGVKP